MKKSLLLLAVLCMVVASSARALVVGSWKNFTNTNDVRGFAYTQGFLWVATTGGLVKFNPATNSREVFTNAEGLGGNFLLSIAADAKGNLWMGADNGTLTKYEPGQNRFTIFPFIDRDNRALKLQSILPDGDRLWIGTDVGVALFLTERNGGEIKEIYRQFGSIDIETPVRALTFFRDSIWVATPQGVAGASKNDPNLLDFSHWKSFRKSPSIGLTSEDCYSLLVFQDTLLVGTSSGVFAYLPDSVRFRAYRSHLASGLVASMAFAGDTLFSAWQYGLVGTIPGNYFDMAGDSVNNSRFFPSLFITPQKELFVSLNGRGFARDRGERSFERPSGKIFRPPGPPGNYFDDLAVDAAGRVWCSNDIYGASMFDVNSSKWTVFDTVPELTGQAWGIDIDQADNKWYSFWGGGASVAWGFQPDSLLRYDTLNSPLVGIPGFNYFVLVTDVAVDYQGNVWFANSLSSNGQALVVRKPDGSFEVFGPADGFFSNDIVALYPAGDHIWIAFKPTGGPGVADFNFNGTVSNHSDDVLIYYNKDNNFILSNRVTAITVDRRGTLWAGTGLGLSRFNADFQVFETINLPQPLGPQVNSIVVDPRNNKWIGTTRGLAVITEEEEMFGPYLPENSGLVSPLINDMVFDPKTGYLWIGTTGGLSRLSTQVLEEAAPLLKVEAFPNPLLLRDTGGRAYFRGLPLDATVNVYNIAGEEVRSLKNSDFWDGRNSKGELVASGVYLFLVADSNGERFTGKLAVIRQF